MQGQAARSRARSCRGPTSMGQPGTYQKQLTGTDDQWQNAEQQQMQDLIGEIRAAENNYCQPKTTQIQQLLSTQIVAHEVNIPIPNIVLCATLVVRILERLRCQVMTPVVTAATLIRQACIHQQTNFADPAVQSGMPRNQTGMHGIVGNDEQPGMQKCPEQNQAANQQPRRLIEWQGEAQAQGEQPGGSNQTSQNQPFAGLRAELICHPA